MIHQRFGWQDSLKERKKFGHHNLKLIRVLPIVAVSILMVLYCRETTLAAPFSGGFTLIPCQDVTFKPGKLGLTLADVNGYAVVSKVTPGGQVSKTFEAIIVI